MRLEVSHGDFRIAIVALDHQVGVIVPNAAGEAGVVYVIACAPESIGADDRVRCDDHENPDVEKIF